MIRLKLQDYSRQIALYEPFEPVITPKVDKPTVISALLKELSHVLTSLGIENNPSDDIQTQRQRLDAAITVLPPHFLSSEFTDKLTRLLQCENKEREQTDVNHLAKMPFLSIGNTKILLWQGDITTLNADAIVNAANSQMLGCFQPNHKCIDNAIHNRAGVQLRADCDAIMKLQAGEEDTGVAKITRAYNLPSKYIIHTVGPIVQNQVLPKHAQRLTSCYRRVLELAKQTGRIRSLAFCSISTGVFGYPIEQATQVAIDAVIQWLTDNPDQLDTIIFNVFSEHDHFIYQSVLEAFVCQQ